MSRHAWWPLIIVVLALAADLVVILRAPLLVRAPIVLLFLLMDPGLAIIGALRVRSLGVELTLALALSLALDTLIAEALVLAQVWSAGLALALLVFVSVAGALLQMALSGLRRLRALAG